MTDDRTITSQPAAADADLWARPSAASAGASGGAVSVVLVLCAVITVLTTAGIILVLGVETRRVLLDVGGRRRSTSCSGPS